MPEKIWYLIGSNVAEIWYRSYRGGFAGPVPQADPQTNWGA
jgi:hypothetical protein